jgi:hypothetical protein
VTPLRAWILAGLAACQPPDPDPAGPRGSTGEPPVHPGPGPGPGPEPPPEDSGAPPGPETVAWELPACDLPDALGTFGWAEGPDAERHVTGVPPLWEWDINATGIALGPPQTVFLARTWRDVWTDELEQEAPEARSALWRSDDAGCTWSELPAPLDRAPLRLVADGDVAYAWTDLRGDVIHDTYTPVVASPELLVWDGAALQVRDVGAPVWTLSARDGRAVAVDTGCGVRSTEDLGASFALEAEPPPTAATLTAAYVDPVDPELVACGYDDGTLWWRALGADWRQAAVADSGWQVTGLARAPADLDRWWALVAIPPQDPAQYGRDARYQVRTAPALGAPFEVVHEMGDGGSGDLHLGRGVLHPSPTDPDEVWVVSAGELQVFVRGVGSIAVVRGPADLRIAEPVRLPGQPTALAWGGLMQMIVEDYR